MAVAVKVPRSVKVSRNPSIFQFTKSQYSLAFPRENHLLGLSDPKLKMTKLPASLLKAVPKRQLHFLAGRTCAMQALALEGCANAFSEIQIGPNHAPIWPSGFIGSITHLDGFASAVVVRTDLLAGIGLDTEAIMPAPLAAKLCGQILNENELNSCRRFFPEWPFELFVTLYFSAKESVYKCLYPLTGKSFGFASVELFDLDLKEHTFYIQLKRELSPQYSAGSKFIGRFEISDGLVHTSIELK